MSSRVDRSRLTLCLAWLCKNEAVLDYITHSQSHMSIVCIRMRCTHKRVYDRSSVYANSKLRAEKQTHTGIAQRENFVLSGLEFVVLVHSPSSSTSSSASVWCNTQSQPKPTPAKSCHTVLFARFTFSVLRHKRWTGSMLLLYSTNDYVDLRTFAFVWPLNDARARPHVE